MIFALAGNPNSGKTTLFNLLTGSSAHVGNWPGVTVDRREGIYRGLPENVGIIDLPGIYSMSPYTPEETISRSFVLGGGPDLVINIVDSTNAPIWIYGLLINGLASGVGSVLSFIPQILMLFLFLSLMEDSGYMARPR